MAPGSVPHVLGQNQDSLTERVWSDFMSLSWKQWWKKSHTIHYAEQEHGFYSPINEL